MDKPSVPESESTALDSTALDPRTTGYKSRHLTELATLSAKNREKQEAKQQQEESKQRQQQALRSRVLKGLNVDKKGSAASLAEGASKRSTSSPAGLGQGLGAPSGSQQLAASSSSTSPISKAVVTTPKDAEEGGGKET